MESIDENQVFPPRQELEGAPDTIETTEKPTMRPRNAAKQQPEILDEDSGESILPMPAVASDRDAPDMEIRHCSKSSSAAASGMAPGAQTQKKQEPKLNGTKTPPSAPYPCLAHTNSLQSHEKEAWRAGGIRFAPLRIPLARRLQTAAVFFHCMAIVLMVSLFWFTCANPLTWPVLIPYLIHLLISTTATDGKLFYQSDKLRSLPLWRLVAAYFPMKLHKTHDLPPNRKYIFGYHPHGIISHGAWCAFATDALGLSDKFPGITNCLLTLDSNFRLPFYRDWLLVMGIQSVSKESMRNILSWGGAENDGQGRAVTIVVGGARESLQAQPGTIQLILRDRKGFVKMALRTGADLVPVIGFGENGIYDQLNQRSYPLVYKAQMMILKLFKFTIPALHGRGLLNYDVGLMPYRRPANIVVGKPIQVLETHGPHPSPEEIDHYHDLYVQEIEQLFKAYKDQFSTGKSPELRIIA